MKRCVFILVFLGSLPGIMPFAVAQVAEEKLPDFLFKKGSIYDLGDVPEGPVATHIFEFSNTGNAPLVITNITTSCGCAVAEWTKEPVLPGKKGIVSVQYRTNGRVGLFTKDIFIMSNVKKDVAENGAYLLHIKGTVKPKDPEMPATGYR